MSKFSTHFYFGTIVKSHALKGEMVVRNLNENTDISKKFDLVFLDLNNQLTPFFVEKMSFRKKGEALLKIVDINSIEQSQEFIKKDLFLANSFLIKRADGYIEFKDLIGFEVTDKKFGAIGKITNIARYPQQEIFEIRFRGKEILIPASEDFIEKIDLKSKTLSINAPEGLIDLYLSDNKNKEEEE